VAGNLIRADQLTDANVAIGDVVKLIDVGASTPGLPATDGRLLATVVGATPSVAGVKGVVPAPAAGEQNHLLHGDGTWRPLGLIPAASYAESEGASSTTSATYQQKLRLTFTAEAGDYEIQWYSEIYSSDSGTRVQTRVQVDDTTNLCITDWNPDDNQKVGYGPTSGFRRQTLTAGSHNIDFDFSTSQAGKSVTVRRVRLRAMRVQ